ncbi:acyltransferase family protein [Geodermatophilus ruber]|uniref:Peptidoglycan/LPS O-acetylase OafA/YrhL, contains acyltransferase and SGNH-hydrolase domains n=1 Tax=Geodermatophilus ruber TaxID=504800 RepID=A0A1I4JXZ6_9ACTN|nr:acyltransferase [Geodermatophilus ruber]SFL71211.1 Peptidoglycan/LPS O-acetylase OafA/YrhL, contains acyltransferase and SGNH-hydrolase domains [Geodermatophilus ruber]
MASATGTETRSAHAPSGRRIDLDVVRGIAIVLALGWHFSRHPSGNPVLDALQWPGGTFGWAGVDLFFVLSGFLVGQLVLREHARTGRFDGRRFTVRRALKLWPVLYVFLAVQALVGTEPWDTYLWQNALHLQNYAGTSLVHLWSLAVEEHFYLALVLLFPLFARRRGSTRLLIGVLAGVLVTALALRVWGTAADLSDVTLQWRTHFRADSLAAGVLLAVVAVHRPELFARLLQRRRLWAGLTLAGIAFLATVGKDGAVGTTIGYTVAYLTAAAFLLLLHKAEWVPRVRWVTAPMAALGRYSYGVYIWHIFAAQVLLGWLPGVAYESWTPVEQVLKYGAAVAVGVVATVLVEKPVLRLRDRLLPASAEVTTPAVPASGWGAGPRPEPSAWAHQPERQLVGLR